MNPNVKSLNRSVPGYTAAMFLACVLVTFNAHAGDFRSETVSYSDLNLSSQSGVQALYGRIHAAAKRVCAQPADWPSPRSCMSKAESDAVSKVNIPLLTAFYQNKTGTQPQTIIASR